MTTQLAEADTRLHALVRRAHVEVAQVEHELAGAQPVVRLERRDARRSVRPLAHAAFDRHVENRDSDEGYGGGGAQRQRTPDAPDESAGDEAERRETERDEQEALHRYVDDV